MPLPKSTPGLSPAVSDLGLGGLLGEQVAGETEEMRKKRMAEMQNRSTTGDAGSAAGMMLFGGGMR